MAATAGPGSGGYSNACSCRKTTESTPAQAREIIKPSITELTKEVRTNILCTVEGCGKILPNSPALNMHLVKSHGVKDGLINPTVRKDMKGVKKLYCCPIEGCPRGPNRPFSQFSLVRQHFMKMHAEKKHRCIKCSNCYSTEWDLQRHMEDCGKIYSCTCGCPYASRAALLSHIYRTGHEVPTEHRYPPVKKRKLEGCIRAGTKVKLTEQKCQMANVESQLSAVMASAACPCNTGSHNHSPTKSFQKLLLPKPKVALLNVPVMQFAQVPVLLSSPDSTAVRSVVLAVNNQGNFTSAVHLLPQSTENIISMLDSKAWNFRDATPMCRIGLGSVSTGVQVSGEFLISGHQVVSEQGQKTKSTSTNIQTDLSCLAKTMTSAELSVSSCSQTDISVSALVQLPVSVETQTFPCKSRPTSTIGAQTDCSTEVTGIVTRETQTKGEGISDGRRQISQSIMCADLFDNESFKISTQSVLKERLYRTDGVEDPLAVSSLYDDKSGGVMCFGSQTEILSQNPVADNQTQTMELFSDLENILSHSITSSSLSNHCTLADSGDGLPTGQENSSSIDFDIEEFLNAADIQTQTEEIELCTKCQDTPLESLDIETQTDFLFLEEPDTSDASGKAQPNYLGLEMFDNQTQTDLNFLLGSSGQIPLGNFLKHPGFSMSSNTQMQTDVPNDLEGHVKLNSTETQTSFSGLGHLFLTSNETQTVMDDFLMADLAWNMESHFSSVETQTCKELYSLFQDPEKPDE